VEVRAERMFCFRCQRARKIRDREVHPRSKLSKGQIGAEVILSCQVEQRVHTSPPRRAIGHGLRSQWHSIAGAWLKESNGDATDRDCRRKEVISFCLLRKSVQ